MSTGQTILVVLMRLSTLAAVWRCSVCSTCSGRPVPVPLPETSGKALLGHSYIRLQQKSLVLCAVRCMKQNKCASFNFYRNDSECELNTETHLTQPGNLAFLPTGGVEYYAIYQWDQNWLGACKDHNCPNDTVCESVSGSPQVTRMCMEAYSPDVTLPGCSWTSGCANCYPMGVVGGRSYSALGCYQNTAHTLSTLMFNDRGNIDWSSQQFFKDMVDKCAQSATNYDMFGIEYYGECYASNNTVAHFNSASFVAAGDCDLKCLYLGVGVGSSSIMFVYKWN